MKYSVDDIKLISLFESITRTDVKDFFVVGDHLLFVVGEGQMGRAMGRNKVHLFKLEHLLKKKLRIVEFSPLVLQFVLNVIAPLQVSDIKEEDKVIILSGKDVRTNSLLIGRQGQNLRVVEKIVKNYFPIDEIKVV